MWFDFLDSLENSSELKLFSRISADSSEMVKYAEFESFWVRWFISKVDSIFS